MGSCSRGRCSVRGGAMTHRGPGRRERPGLRSGAVGWVTSSAVASERLTTVLPQCHQRLCVDTPSRCATCGSAFVSRSSSQRYCGERCRDVAYGLNPDRPRPPYERACANCSKAFTSQRSDGRYCSASCRKAVLRDRQHNVRERAERDDGHEALLRCDPCAYCGGPGGGVDHIDSLAGGGLDDLENLTGACVACNSSKRDRPLLVWLLARRAPRRAHCPVCGSSLAGRRSDARTCSDECRRQMWRVKAILEGNGPLPSLDALWQRRAKVLQREPRSLAFPRQPR
jgi:predicted nucleic acid-binding Zn ribbon protein